MQVSGHCLGSSDVSNLTPEALNQRDTAQVGRSTTCAHAGQLRPGHLIVNAGSEMRCRSPRRAPMQCRARMRVLATGEFCAASPQAVSLFLPNTQPLGQQASLILRIGQISRFQTKSVHLVWDGNNMKRCGVKQDIYNIGVGK